MAKGGRRARAGRPRKPTEQKVIQGTFRQDRHGDEVRAEPKRPVMPEGLTESERKVWEDLMGLTESWLSESDKLAALGVVSLYDRLQRNIDVQRTTGARPILISKKRRRIRGVGLEETVEVRENPLITQEIKLWRELRAYMGIMGLSPVDRARVRKDDGGNKPKPLSPLASLLKRRASLA